MDGTGALGDRVLCAGSRKGEEGGHAGIFALSRVYFDVGCFSADRGAGCAEGGKVSAGGTGF